MILSTLVKVNLIIILSMMVKIIMIIDNNNIKTFEKNTS